MTYQNKEFEMDIILHQEAKKLNDAIVDRLIAYRKQMGLTQQDIADATGIQRANIARIESKKSMTSIDSLEKYASSLGYELKFEMVPPEKNHPDKNMDKNADKNLNGDQSEVQNQNQVQTRKRPLPVGCSDFKRVSTEYCYVDKTLLIRDVLDENIVVSLFTRPRRFGKTLNMDMLRVFFEKTDEDTSVYFKDKLIWQCDECYTKHQGKYPVIWLTFKEVKFFTWEENVNFLRFIFAVEYNRHSELFESDKCNRFEKKQFEKVAAGEATEMDLVLGLRHLADMLYKHHGVSPIIMIDEYDSPVQQGYMHGFYEKAVAFVRGAFSYAFKDNPHLTYAFLTGILRVAKESIFSGLNNLKVNTILEEDYSQYFGFIPDEVQEMAKYYDAQDKYEELCRWYDGYRFGSNHIFNPWSVINYFNSKCTPKPFWVNTSSNDVIGEIIETATSEMQDQLQELMKGNEVLISGDMSIIYPNLKHSSDALFSFLLVTGYLKITEAIPREYGEFSYKVAIPNIEIASVYSREVLTRFQKGMKATTGTAIQEALIDCDAQRLQSQIQEMLYQTVSYYDAAKEDFYHGFMLGLCVMMNEAYEVASNRESGEGRFDIQLKPKKKDFPGILIEIKSVKNAGNEELIRAAKAGLEQMENRKYDAEMKKSGIENVSKYSVAFSGKNVHVVSKFADMTNK